MSKARQTWVLDWAVEAFGPGANHPVERGMRVAEEAIELAQATGATREEVHSLVEFIYAKPPGDLTREVGQVALTLDAVAELNGIDAQAEGWNELRRVLKIDPAKLRARHDKKVAAGVGITL
jgi:NTP pyrophosphatase (non-canonical NTP hydrolase)